MRKASSAKCRIVTAILLMLLWFVMSGRTEPKFIILGAVSSAAVAFICLKTLTAKGQTSDREYYLLEVNIFRLALYFLWLLWQIVVSAVYTAGVSLFRTSELDPQIVWFRADYDNPAARAMLANSITLTPGTITVDIDKDGLYSVHALTDKARAGLLDGSMQAKVAWLYGETIEFRSGEEAADE